MIQNGSEAFVHPVTGKRIAPFEFYEGNAHQEHENVVEEELTQQDDGKLPEDDGVQQDDGKLKGKKKPPKEGE